MPPRGLLCQGATEKAILHYHEIKQVMPVVREGPERLVVIRVYAFYFGGGQ